MGGFKRTLRAATLLLIGMIVALRGSVFRINSVTERPGKELVDPEIKLPIGPETNDADVWALLLEYGWKDGRMHIER